MLRLLDPWTSPTPMTDDLGRVGIVMRTKNRPLFLARGLSSVINQTYSNFSLVVVNDGGEYDVCESVLQDFRDLFGSRLTVLHNRESAGMEAASNAGLAALSDVSFFAIHDDDDSWHRDFLKQTVSFLNSEDGQLYGAVATRVEVIEEVVDQDRVRVVGQYPYGPWREPIDIRSYLQANSFPPISLLTRWQLLDKTGGFDSRMPVLGDWDFGIRLMMHADIATLSESLAYYHLRPEGSGIHGNTVRDQFPVHVRQKALFLNRTWRACVDNAPEAFWLTLVSAQNTNELNARLDALVDQVSSFKPGEGQSETAAALDRLESAVRQLHARIDSGSSRSTSREGRYGVNGNKGTRGLLTALRRRISGGGPPKHGPHKLDPSTYQDSPVDPEWYLRAYPDVAASGIDPHEHYARWGKHEGRSPGPQKA